MSDTPQEQVQNLVNELNALNIRLHVQLDELQRLVLDAQKLAYAIQSPSAPVPQSLRA